MRSLLLAMLVTAVDATAQPLFIKTADVKLLSSPGGKVLQVLQPGAEVTWKASDPKGWQRVFADGTEGFVHRRDLTPLEPHVELRQPPTNASKEAGRTVQSGRDPATVEKELAAVEQLNRDQPRKAIDDHAKASGRAGK